jgi:hydrogenase nickel incorporation protein HypA/HybF
MHELSIALSILDIAADEAEQRGVSWVEAIHVRLGPLSGVVKEALLSAYELAREGTPFAESRLVIEEAPLVVYCEACQGERPAESSQSMRCVECQTLSARVVSGQELMITAMEIPA